MPYKEDLDDYIMIAEVMLRHRDYVTKIAESLLNCIKRGGTIYIAGNAGAGSNAEHFVSELVGRFYRNRPAIPAVSLNSDTTTITCIANDFGFENIFKRQLEALFNPDKDFFIGMSTSGNSQNIILALKYLNDIGGDSLALFGKNGGKFENIKSRYCNILIVPSHNTPRIQEFHMFLLHYWAEYIERHMFGGIY